MGLAGKPGGGIAAACPDKPETAPRRRACLTTVPDRGLVVRKAWWIGES